MVLLQIPMVLLLMVASYTKDELIPLIDEVVTNGEQMNENDREYALRIYQENMRGCNGLPYRLAKKSY